MSGLKSRASQHGVRSHRRSMKRMRALGLQWALATVAPWALSAGMLVSFTASAGQSPQDQSAGQSLMTRVAPGPGSDLDDGPSLLTAASAFHLPGLELGSSLNRGHDGTIHSARHSFDEPERLVPMNRTAPRPELKSFVSGYPQVDRSAKGDPIPFLRPTMTRLPDSRALSSLIFGENESGLVSAGFAREALDFTVGPQIGFEPWRPDDTMTDTATAEPSPATPGSATTSSRAAERHLESIDGSTPSVPLSIASSSTTPQLMDPAFQQMAQGSTSRAEAPQTAMLPPERPAPSSATAPASAVTQNKPAATTVVRKAEEPPRSRFTHLVAAGRMEREMRCLAEVVYFEARSEPERGQAAVAQVVLNRVQSDLYPNTICGVVYQNRHRHLACQFTFACEGKSLRITEPEPWRVATRISRAVFEGRTYLADVGTSTHYHADYVRPYWAKKLRKMDVIGRHVFYRLRPGQT
ncbi:MAG: cell wall hydrolase [Bosea sp. (in: a-proteobacteria)]